MAKEKHSRLGTYVSTTRAGETVRAFVPPPLPPDPPVDLSELHQQLDRANQALGRLDASIVNEQTGNLKLAQKFLGHSTIKMTADIYTHTSAEAERGAAIALERAIYGDLFPVVPNIENRNNSAALN